MAQHHQGAYEAVEAAGIWVVGDECQNIALGLDAEVITVIVPIRAGTLFVPNRKPPATLEMELVSAKPAFDSIFIDDDVEVVPVLCDGPVLGARIQHCVGFHPRASSREHSHGPRVEPNHAVQVDNRGLVAIRQCSRSRNEINLCFAAPESGKHAHADEPSHDRSVPRFSLATSCERGA